MEVKRYGWDHVAIGVCDDADFIERADGDYVRYDDIKHLLNSSQHICTETSCACENRVIPVAYCNGGSDKCPWRKNT